MRRSFLFIAIACLVAGSGCGASLLRTPSAHLVTPAEQHLRRGEELEKQGLVDQAAEEYSLSAEFSAKGTEALSRLLLKQGRAGQAERILRDALARGQNSSGIYSGLARSLLRQGIDLDEAEELAMIAVKTADDADFAESWNTLNDVRVAKRRASSKTAR
ncbi:MAG: hypothetical protein PUB69_05575 [Desulfovibrionaceae bacterium]|nr:hypothetical protein [Desulfovibrionaceae bacterium]